MKELDIAGVYITPILGWALLALVVWTVLRRLIDKWAWRGGSGIAAFSTRRCSSSSWAASSPWPAG